MHPILKPIYKMPIELGVRNCSECDKVESEFKVNINCNKQGQVGRLVGGNW